MKFIIRRNLLGLFFCASLVAMNQTNPPHLSQAPAKFEGQSERTSPRTSRDSFELTTVPPNSPTITNFELKEVIVAPQKSPLINDQQSQHLIDYLAEIKERTGNATYMATRAVRQNNELRDGQLFYCCLQSTCTTVGTTVTLAAVGALALCLYFKVI